MTRTMTTAEARGLGYEITRGAYNDTPDNRNDAWYIERINDTAVRRSGRGFATRRDALSALAERLGD